MSSRRYQEDIRRIVGMPDLTGGLDYDLPRMRIDGTRGIFLIGAGETQTGASPGTDADGNDKDPITPPEGDGNTNDDGSGTGDGNTDSGATNPDDFIDDQDESNWGVGDDLFGGNWGANGATTFSDCADGTCVELVDGDRGYIPPEGWDSADEPPLDPEYEAGFYWFTSWQSPQGSTATIGYHQTISAGRSSLRSSASDCPAALDTLSTQTGGFSSSGGCGEFGSVSFSMTLNRRACSTAFNPICNDPPPRPESWPSDDCIQLAKNSDGQWASSPYESPDDMTAKYSEPKSSLDLCTPSGDGVQILPGADGGTVYWNYTKGIYRAVSPDGKQSFGGSSGVTQAVAGSVAGGADGPKAVGSPVPSG